MLGWDIQLRVIGWKSFSWTQHLSRLMLESKYTIIQLRHTTQGLFKECFTPIVLYNRGSVELSKCSTKPPSSKHKFTSRQQYSSKSILTSKQQLKIIAHLQAAELIGKPKQKKDPCLWWSLAQHPAHSTKVLDILQKEDRAPPKIWFVCQDQWHYTRRGY